ncbi:MAG TPA: hypothetical protein VMV10_14530 [Pirellulales bacterium]|nr:hypothetical protein [Pirellulales bacterium]
MIVANDIFAGPRFLLAFVESFGRLARGEHALNQCRAHRRGFAAAFEIGLAIEILPRHESGSQFGNGRISDGRMEKVTDDMFGQMKQPSHEALHP